MSKRPKHPFTWTRKTPKGQPDPSIAFCDDCGEKVEHEIHQGATQADYNRGVLEAIRGGE